MRSSLVLCLLVGLSRCCCCDAFLPQTTTSRSSWRLHSQPNTDNNSLPVMISQRQRQILIEDLGYRRKDVDRLRLELVVPILEQKLSCPSDGVPVDWLRPPTQAERLEQESKYPLKLPLLGIGLILFGKGFGDALITTIKVETGFPGASFGEDFLGVPVVLIDGLCVFVGAAMGLWTLRTMKD